MSDSDGCDEKTVKVNRPELSERQQRFLDAYRQRLAIAPAARLAGVHRTSIYRWLKEEVFAAAMKAAVEDFFREVKAKVLAQEAAREQWRRQREQERLPMRRYFLAKARAIKLGHEIPPMPNF